MLNLHNYIFPAIHRYMRLSVTGKISASLLALVMFTNSYSQGNQWAWMSTTDSYGIYGTKGVPSTANKPGSRSNAFFWKDHTGSFWLFGGGGLAQSTEGNLNDLWKFNPLTNEWTWVAGDSIINVLGVYGTMGVAAPTNIIGCRLEGTGWSDAAGNIWIFGGSIPEPGIEMDRNDLWKYDPLTGYWTWMHGTQTRGDEGTYGTQGVASPANNPKARAEGAGWADDAGNIYLFGGISYYNGITPWTTLSDLWKYSTVTNQWTWLKGMRSFEAGIYGTRGVASVNNRPGSRTSTSACKGPDGNFWLISGVGADAQLNSGLLNDLWKYNPQTNEWTWVSGDSLVNQLPVYGSQAVAAASNKPGARYLCAAWMDNLGNFWVYGGYGFLEGNSADHYRLSDLWQYKPSTDLWTWVKGDSAVATSFPVYGTQGIPNINNKPGDQVIWYYWADDNNNLWLAGQPPGGVWELEFWKYIPDYSGVPVSLTAFGGVYRNDHTDLDWSVENEANLDRYEVERSLDGLHYRDIGSVHAANLKQYHLTDADIPGGAKQLFYRLRIVDADGKYVFSKVVSFGIAYQTAVVVNPNPAAGQLNIILDEKIRGNTEVAIIDAGAKLLLKKSFNVNSSLLVLPVDQLPAGNYVLRLVNQGKRYLTRVTIKR